MKTVFDSMDNFIDQPYDVTRVYESMLDYFEVSDRNGMLDHFYNDFNKKNFAGFCKVLSDIATKENDPLAKWCFAEAGRLLAHHIVAIEKDIDESIKSQKGGPHVICIGSVWKSWPLLKDSFEKGKIYSLSFLVYGVFFIPQKYSMVIGQYPE